MAYSMPGPLRLALAFAALAWPQSGMKEVVYQADGTAKYANLMLTNPSGGKEQNQVKLPFELKFYAKSGQFLYLSAQKTRVTETVHYPVNDRIVVLDDGVTGTVHVLIKVSGAVLQEASSSSPYGVATAEGKLPE